MNYFSEQRIRDRLKGEEGTFFKAGASLKVGLVYPNKYFFGMSNLGFQVLYHLLNRNPQTACERMFLPEEDVLPHYSRGGLKGYEQGTPGREMDLIAFSISYQNDYLNVVPLLYLMGLKSHAADRDEADPLVIAGGPALTINPEPVAPFFDAMVMGEGEEVIQKILEVLRETGGKRERLEALAKLEGVYVPALFENHYRERDPLEKAVQGFGLVSGQPNGRPQKGEFVRRLVVRDAPLAHSTVLTRDTEFGDLFLIEVQRGCQWGCRFCAAGFMYRYPRYELMDQLKERVDLGLKYRKKVGLIAGDLLGYDSIHEILEYIDSQGGGFSPSSVRLNAFTPKIIHFLKKSGNRTVAIAPEAGSERLRRGLNKTFTDEEVVEAAVRLAEGGIANLKLYIMIGLPTETERDIEDLIQLTVRTREALTHMAKSLGRMPSLTLSVSPFTPKPSTPLQSSSFAGVTYLKGVMSQIRKRLLKQGHIRLSGESPHNAYVETLLSRGDRRVSEFLLKATVPVGKAIAAGNPSFQRAALASVGFDTEVFVGREMPLTEPLPWDFIDHGIKTPFFVREIDKFQRGKITHYCMPEVCRSCGVC